MVDFSNSNLCGASPELNSVLLKLEDAKSTITDAIDDAAGAAASAFGAAQNELNGLLDKLQTTVIPELPKLNLQAEIKSLTSQIPGTASYISALAKIQSEFGSDISAKGLELESLITSSVSAISGGGNLSAIVPNFEKESGSIVPAIEIPPAVLQAAEAAVSESLSTVTQNASVEANLKDIGEKTAKYLVTNTLPTEDSGGFKVVPNNLVETISSKINMVSV
jgi:hypothetical protein